MTRRTYSAFNVIVIILGVVAAIIAVIAIWLYQTLLSYIPDSPFPQSEPRVVSSSARFNLFAELGRPSSAYDTIVFQDGVDGWFVITDPAQANEVEISYTRKNLFQEMTQSNQETTHCTVSGTVIWAVKDNNRVSTLRQCGDTQLVLAELRSFATPARISTQDLNAQGRADLRQRIADDPTLIGVDTDPPRRAFDSYFTIQAPYAWDVEGADFETFWKIENRINAWISTQRPKLRDAFSVDIEIHNSASNTHYVKKADGTGFEPGTSGYSVLEGDQWIIMPDLDRLGKLEATVNCHRAACETLRTLDFETLLARPRDIAVLNAAIATAIPMTGRPGANNVPEVSALMGDTFTWGDVITWDYVTIYATLSP